MPVEILGFQIEREGVCKKHIERGRDLFGRGLRQIGRGIEVGGDLVGPVVWLGFAHDGPSCWEPDILRMRLVKNDAARQWTSVAGPSNASSAPRFPRPEPVFTGRHKPWTTGSII